jgi:hypothetical protein
MWNSPRPLVLLDFSIQNIVRKTSALSVSCPVEYQLVLQKSLGEADFSRSSRMARISLK